MGNVFFATSLTIPAETTWTEPYELVFEIPAGTVIEWLVQGAPEHQHQVSISIYYQGHRVFPEGELEVFYTCEQLVQVKTSTFIIPGVRQVVVRGANDDDSYGHSVYVGATVYIETMQKSPIERLFGLFSPPTQVEV